MQQPCPNDDDTYTKRVQWVQWDAKGGWRWLAQHSTGVACKIVVGVGQVKLAVAIGVGTSRVHGAQDLLLGEGLAAI